jgi:hypothetical protein
MIDVSSHNMGKLSVSQTVNKGTSNVSVSEEVDHGNIFGPVNRKRELTANISNSLPTDVEVNTGASKFNFDFSKLKLENFTLSSGAVTGEVTFGKNVSLLSGKIETGASSITVRVPKGVGLKVNYKGALNNPNFASGLGLNKTGDDLYQTADYDSSANKIDLSIDAGVSSIKIIQY